MDSVDLVERLRTRGWNMTAQRRTIVEVLADGDGQGHRTAEQIHVDARQRLPEVSLTTVYNTLRELVSMGEICELRGLGGSVRYDADLSAHHHLRCLGCDEVVDVHPEGVDALRVPPAGDHGYTLLGVEVIFEGRCASCS